MNPRFKSLKGRLVLWVFLPTVLISAVDLFVTSNTTDDVATLVQEQLLKGSARTISEQLAKADEGYEISVPPAAFELFESEYKDHVYYAVRSKNGTLIAGNEELAAYSGQLQIEQEKYYLATIRGEPVRVIAYAQSLPNTTTGDYAITQVAQTLRGHDAFKKKLFLLTMREHLILLSIVMLGLIIAFRWTLSPLIQFGKTLLERQPGSLEKLDEKNAPKELEPVIFAMNDYVARLDKTLTSYEQFVANTAHQLRTSFAIITSQIDFGLRSDGIEKTQAEVLIAIRKTIQQGTKVINQLLLLATFEQDRHTKRSDIAANFAQIIQSVMEERAPLAQQKRIDLGIDVLDETIFLMAPEYLLHELVSNLVDNAIKHIQDEGMVTVSLQRKDDRIVMSVVDDGPGIPETEWENVFARFYRLNDSRPDSSGLGLSIVKGICDVLKADIALSKPANGAGLQVDVAFRDQVQGSK